MTAHTKKIPLIGLMGGIGSGKSTVAGLFEKLGCVAINADAIAHQVLETAQVKEALCSRFGRNILTGDGRVDRRAIAALVFSDPEKLAFLNGLVHPPTLKQVQDVISAVRRQGRAKGIVIDAPLLVEAGWDKECDILVFVECHYDKRLGRLQARAGLDEQQMTAREKFQISLDRKAKLAYYTIDNNADFSALESQVGCVFSKITGVE